MAIATRADVLRYRFRGMAAEGSGKTLEEAADSLSDFWYTRSTLHKKDAGAMTLIIEIDGEETMIEITDWNVLDNIIIDGETTELINYMAKYMGVSAEDVTELLARTDRVEMTVSHLRVPHDPGAWIPSAGTEPSEVLPGAALQWMEARSREEDIEAGRDIGRKRSAASRKWLRMAIKTGRDQGLTDTEIARKTGFPRSTVYDTRVRMKRESQVTRTFPRRRKGQPLTDDQQAIVLQKLADHDNNAAEVARDLGMAPRTVRDLRARLQRRAVTEGVANYRDLTPTMRVRKTYTAADKAKLLDTVRRQGITATIAGRKLGVSDRTARDWVRAAKLKADKK